eukprot:2082732-Rhodomonas_salina.1
MRASGFDHLNEPSFRGAPDADCSPSVDAARPKSAEPGRMVRSRPVKSVSVALRRAYQSRRAAIPAINVAFVLSPEVRKRMLQA